MAKKQTKDQVIIFHEDNTMTFHPVLSQEGNMVETDTNLLDLKDAKTFLNASKGAMTYLFHLDLPAKIEAENLKNLRRSTALKRAFEFDRKTGEINWAAIMPYIIIILLVLFK